MAIWSALFTGLCSGLAQILYYILFGKSYALSMNTACKNHPQHYQWKAALTTGIMFSLQSLSFIVKKPLSVAGVENVDYMTDFPKFVTGCHPMALAMGALLISFGAKLGKGCIIDHTHRLALEFKRTAIAYTVMLGCCAITSSLSKSNYAGVSYFSNARFLDFYMYITNFAIFSVLIFLLVYVTEKFNNLRELALSLLSGLFLGCGMMCSTVFTMLRAVITPHSSTSHGKFELLLSILAETLVVLYGTRLISKRMSHPKLKEHFTKPKPTTILNLVGYALFGMGWGITRLTPLTALLYGFISPYALIYLPCIVCGYVLGGVAEHCWRKKEKQN